MWYVVDVEESADPMENPFKLTSDNEIFLLRDKEKRRKMRVSKINVIMFSGDSVGRQINIWLAKLIIFYLSEQKLDTLINVPSTNMAGYQKSYGAHQARHPL